MKFDVIILNEASGEYLKDTFDVETEDDLHSVVAESYPGSSVAFFEEVKQFMIAGKYCEDDKDFMFWSNTTGWGSREAADKFDCSGDFNLPMDASGIVFIDDIEL